MALTVVGKVRDAAEVDRVQQMAGGPVAATVPADEALAACGHVGVG